MSVCLFFLYILAAQQTVVDPSKKFRLTMVIYNMAFLFSGLFYFDFVLLGF